MPKTEMRITRLRFRERFAPVGTSDAKYQELRAGGLYVIEPFTWQGAPGVRIRRKSAEREDSNDIAAQFVPMGALQAIDYDDVPVKEPSK